MFFLAWLPSVCFKVFDVDHDGVLSRDELHEMVVALLEVWKDNRTDTLPVSSHRRPLYWRVGHLHPPMLGTIQCAMPLCTRNKHLYSKVYAPLQYFVLYFSGIAYLWLSLIPVTSIKNCNTWGCDGESLLSCSNTFLLSCRSWPVVFQT